MPVTFERILCAVTLKECTEKVVKYGASLAKRYGAKLYIATVVEEPSWGKEPELSSFMATLEERTKTALERLAVEVEDITKGQVESVVLRGKVAQEILRFAEEIRADLPTLTVDFRNAFYFR